MKKWVLFAMPMQINDKPDLSFSTEFLDKRFDRGHLWAILVSLGGVPFSI
jgi:hypothetical protein